MPIRRYEYDESGSYGGSGVGQAPELPLESDPGFSPVDSGQNPQQPTFLQQLLWSFSDESLAETRREIGSWFSEVRTRIPRLPSVSGLKLPMVPKLKLPIRQRKREVITVYKAPPTVTKQTDQTSKVKAQVSSLSGTIYISPEKTNVYQEERFFLGTQEDQWVELPPRRTLVQEARLILDAWLWLLSARSNLSFKRFAVNPQPVYARTMRVTGSAFLGLSLFVMVFFGAPFLALELRSAVNRMSSGFQTTAEPDIPQVQMPVEDTVPEPGTEFQIKIPMIGVDAKVIPNVDASNPAEYEEALMHGVAHAQGTGLPGHDGGINKSIFIFSHSTNGSWNITRFNALFYSLKDLKPEDQVQVWFWGKEYWYRVTETRIVEDDDTAFLEPQLEKEQLILQTCWPPGTVDKRLIVIAERVDGVE